MNQQIYPALVAILAAGRAYNFTDPYILPENPVGSLPETPSDVPTTSSVDAITGADGAQSDGVSLKVVFQDLVRTTRNRSPTCMSSSSLSKIFELTGALSWCYVVPSVSDTFHLTLPRFRSWLANVRTTSPKWPVRSVETLPIFTRKALSNRVLVIGNSVGLSSPRAWWWLIKRIVVDRPHHSIEKRKVYHPTTWERERGVG